MSSVEQLRRYVQLIAPIIADETWCATTNLPGAQLLDQYIQHQQPDGAFLPPDENRSPESRWFDERVILHAAALRAVDADDQVLNAAVKNAAEYQLREIQPDHATADPWALLAYIQYALPLADQVLHAMQMQYPQGPRGVPLSLLADALYGLRRLIKEPS